MGVLKMELVMKKKLLVIVLLSMIFLLIGCSVELEPIEVDLVKVIGGYLKSVGDPVTEESYNYKITKPYMMSVSEVTQKQWQLVMGDNPSEFIGVNYPVESISWFDAIEFCNKLSVRNGFEPVYEEKKDGTILWDKNKVGYRLPTEAEWQYACRAGHIIGALGTYESPDIYEFGFTYQSLSLRDVNYVLQRYCWYITNSDSTTHDVCKKRSNDYGLFDMHGNVYEWCWDGYGDLVSGAEDPIGETDSKTKVFRGGSYLSLFGECAVNYRHRSAPKYKCNDLGFRIVLDVITEENNNE
jgi:formylglycine-generating enzyme